MGRHGEEGGGFSAGATAAVGENEEEGRETEKLCTWEGTGEQR